MKSFVFYFLVLSSFLINQSFAQEGITLCGGSPVSNQVTTPFVDPFVQLASNETFSLQHDLPLPFTYQNNKGEMISFKTKEGKDGNAYFVKSKTESKKYLFVFHEWWGLNDYIKREADKLSSDLEDVNILAIDLYDGKAADSREKAQDLVKAVEEERAEEIIKGALEFSGRNARVGTIGWCFGGGWSLKAAIIAGSHTVACVMYYGMPVDDVDDLKKLKTPVLGIFAEKDKSITPEVVEEFEENMDEAEE